MMEKKKPRIRRTHGGVGFEDTDDGLSDLPDNLLHHVLSFLDTKSMVQSSVLSRRWRCLWKDVTALNFCARYFQDQSIFRKHAAQVLSLRSSSASVSSVAFEFCDFVTGHEADMNLFDSVMKYAASHGMMGSEPGGLQHFSITHDFSDFEFSELAPYITAHRQHNESLKDLKLGGVNFRCGGAPVLPFNFLTTVELRRCWFYSSSPLKTIEPFADLPHLNCLKLIDCTSEPSLKVSGLQLLDLEIQHSSCMWGGLKVVAPKVKRFLFESKLYNLTNLDLPSLACATIILGWEILHEIEKEEHQIELHRIEVTNQGYMKMLRDLHNATSLDLRLYLC